MGFALDATFVIDLLASDIDALAKARTLDASDAHKTLPAPVLYEVSIGPLRSGSGARLTRLRRLLSGLEVLPLDEGAAVRAAELQVELLGVGRPLSSTDALIAGIASAGGHTLVTRNGRFDDAADVVGLDVETY